MEQTLRSAAAVRNRLEACRGLHVSLQMLPIGACDTASLVLDRYFEHEAGLGPWVHVTGTAEDGLTRVWLEQDGLIVDITDQVEDVHDPVIVTFDRSWRERRFPEQLRRPTSDSSLAAASTALGHLHRAVARPD